MTRQSSGGLDGNMPRPAASNTRSSRKAQGRKGDTCVYHNGFQYTKGWTSMVKMKFRCSVYRSIEPPYKALLHVYAAGGCKVTGNSHAFIRKILYRQRTLLT